MPTTVANISWLPIAGSTGTLIEYRKVTDTLWIKPVSPANPTLYSSYDLTIESNTQYYVRLTRYGSKCAPKSVVISIISPGAACCPVGYTLSPDASYCYQIIEIDATPPSGAVQNLVSRSFASYSTCGTYIYSPGYALNGTGTSSKITNSNPFWVNGSGSCIDATTTNGPLNRTGVWVSPPQDNQDIGFSICINISSSKTYYIGIGGDNYPIIKLDGNIIVQQDPTAIDAQYSIGGSCFKVWHIYPLTISAGPHILELIGHNISGPASIGCEVYDALSTDLIAATSYGDLGANLLFSSKNSIGTPAQIGTGNVAYTCPATYALAACDIPIKCRKIIETPTVTC